MLDQMYQDWALHNKRLFRWQGQLERTLNYLAIMPPRLEIESASTA